MIKNLRKFLDKQEKLFAKGGKFSKLHPLYDMVDTILYSTGYVTRSASHARDGMDLKRMMLTVIFALQPLLLFSFYNQGYQNNLALANGFGSANEGWRIALMQMLGLGIDPANVLDNFVHGMLYFIPMFLVVQITGGIWEPLFAVVRKHEVNEGFLVTGMLIPLILPPDTPLWQVFIGTSFGVVLGKEVFGGTGFNILNPALTARAFLFFAYPADISGDAVWTAVDGFSGATALGQLASWSENIVEPISVLSYPAYSLKEGVIDPHAGLNGWWRYFIGLHQGSFGETSTLLCIIGAIYLILTKIGSWRIMLGVLLGTIAMTLTLNTFGASDNALMQLPFYWHFVLGGFAFGTVFMATDPVSASMTDKGRWIYGFFIGVIVVLIRVINPAFPEGMMLSILFMNIFSPLIDHFVVQSNIKKRRLSYER